MRPIQSVPMKILKLMFLILLGLGLSTHAFAAPLQAKIDRASVRMGETFNLTLTLKGESSAKEPDLNPLRHDFDILGSGSNSQVSIINGNTSTVTQWTVVLSPKQSGNITIPSLSLGKTQSAPLIIKVKSSKASSQTENNKDVFLEAFAEPENPYLQSQIIYTTRLY